LLKSGGSRGSKGRRGDAETRGHGDKENIQFKISFPCSSFISHPSSFILYPLSFILYPSSFIRSPSSLLLRLELVFGGSAYGANPILWNVFKGSSWLNAAVGIAFFRIVDITADSADITHIPNLPD
jgi:hypothetical protein